MPNFQHLPLIQIVERKPFVGRGGGPKKGVQARYNLEHRQEHFDNLTSQIETVRETWLEGLMQRDADGLPELTDKDTIPLFLHIDLAKDIESLKSFGIEVISEEEDGFIIGANSDNFALFRDRLDQFINQNNQKFKDSAATILDVISEPTQRLRHILSSDLLVKWDRIQDEREMTVYIAISSYLKTPPYPTKGETQTDQSYQAAIERWKARNEAWEIAKDELAMQRQTAFEAFIQPYNGVFVSTISNYTEFDDGFACKVRMSGAGVKDLALSFPYVFRIEEHDPMFSFQGTEELEALLEIEINSPDVDAPKVCIIDSGIQEGHRLLAPAVDSTLSISYVPGDGDTFDKVSGGGHGTRVAGVVLYPNGISNGTQQQQAPFWIQNARILDHENLLPSTLNEVDIMKAIVQRFNPTRIFNLSVARSRPEYYNKMPIWSATIDQLIWQNDVLFCIAAGNIPSSSNHPEIPGVLNYLQQGSLYPDFLKDKLAKITNPAYSCFALSVGSITDSDFEDQDFRCVALRDQPSSFSRSGPGLWGMIKPDVVEYGGDFVIDKTHGQTISTHAKASPNLIRSTRDNGPAIGRDAVGTSFTTPKVTHIAAALQQMYPHETCLLYRALIVQSARLPLAASNVVGYIQHYGYGLPDINRAISNTPTRVTLYNTSEINPKNADIYLIKIPDAINRPGLDFQVLIEITLSYKAEPRITRRRTNSYLSAWLDWETSRRGEDQQTFSARILASGDQENEEPTTETGEVEQPVQDTTAVRPQSFKWTIGSKGNEGDIEGVKRQDSSMQKDWCIVPSNQLPSEFLLAVKGHKGWQKDLDKKIPYAIVVSFEILTPEINIDIYNIIRIANEIEIENERRVQVEVEV